MLSDLPEGVSCFFGSLSEHQKVPALLKALSMHVEPVTLDIMERAAALAVQHHLLTNDAVSVAVMEKLGLSHLLKGRRQAEVRRMDATEFALPAAALALYDNVLTQSEAHLFFAEVLHHTTWKQEVITFYGRERKLPRLTAWYGDPDACYRYSGVLNQPLTWTPTLTAVRAHVHQVTGHSFNSVLLNLYRSGADSVAWRADNEPELAENPVSASISLGETRVFQLRHTTREEVRRFALSLPPGSLLLMLGAMQTHWQHRIPKTRRSITARINLTFRNITRRSESRREL